jgi:hypothetical protein
MKISAAFAKVEDDKLIIKSWVIIN